VIEVSAPGRVNLIGEHTDYAGGLVLPVAIDRYVTVKGDAADTIRLGTPLAPVVAEELGLGVGFEGTISSSVPRGAGLASSAALGVAIAGALCAVADARPDLLELAEACRRAEERSTGVPCGIMDQAASALGRSGHALFLDCGSLVYEHVPLPEDVTLVVLDSKVRRRLDDGRYAQRRSEVEAGEPRRLRHVESENGRVQAAVEALRGSELAALGQILLEGHRSLRDDFEVSVPALDALVEAAVSAGAYGARLTGAGFGGCVLALAPPERAEAIAAVAPSWVVRSADGLAAGTLWQ
jgi:galactokinase